MPRVSPQAMAKRDEAHRPRQVRLSKAERQTKLAIRALLARVPRERYISLHVEGIPREPTDSVFLASRGHARGGLAEDA